MSVVLLRLILNSNFVACLMKSSTRREKDLLSPPFTTLLHISLFFGCHKSFVLLLFFNLSPAFLSLYSTSYPEAISLLTKLLQAKHTNSLLASTQKLLQHRLPLGSYLLKPVQRILKYHLLLDVSYPVE